MLLYVPRSPFFATSYTNHPPPPKKRLALDFVRVQVHVIHPLSGVYFPKYG